MVSSATSRFQEEICTRCDTCRTIPLAEVRLGSQPATTAPLPSPRQFGGSAVAVEHVRRCDPQGAPVERRALDETHGREPRTGLCLSTGQGVFFKSTTADM